jgi:hypothetical protein
LTNELEEKKERKEEYFNKQLVDRCKEDKKELNTYKPYASNNLDSDEECTRKMESTKCKINYLSDDSEDEKAKRDKMAERSKRYKEALNKLDNWSLGEMAKLLKARSGPVISLDKAS